MPAYDRNSFDPPAPVAYVTVRDPVSGTEVLNVPMLLDSGADVTLLPAPVLRAAGLSTSTEKQYEFFWLRRQHEPGCRRPYGACVLPPHVSRAVRAHRSAMGHPGAEHSELSRTCV